MLDFTRGLVKKGPVDFKKGLVKKDSEKPKKQEAKSESAAKEVTPQDLREALSSFLDRLETITKSAGAEPIGAEDPETGRDVLHKSDDPEAIAEKAKAEHPAVKAALKEAISGVQGAKLHGDRDEKHPERVEEKIEDEGQPAKTIPDYSGFRVAVDSHEAHHAAVDAIKGKLKVVREKDEFEQGAPDTKFHAHMLQVQHPGSDVTHEVQVLPKQVADVAVSNHPMYEKARTGDTVAAAEVKAKNEEAWKQFEASTNSETKGGRGESPEQVKAEGARPSAPLKKGDTVKLKDGSHGVVDFVPAWGKLGKVRVKTADGRTVRDVPQKDIEPTDGGWVGFDLDKTLAKYDGDFKGHAVIGEPIPKMVDRAKQHIKDGDDVRVLTARVADDKGGEARKAIQEWTEKHVGKKLPVTDRKDSKMKILYDDRARQVVPNEGTVVGEA